MQCGGWWSSSGPLGRSSSSFEPPTRLEFQPCFQELWFENNESFQHSQLAELVTICKWWGLARVLEQFLWYRSCFSASSSTPAIHPIPWSTFTGRGVKHLTSLHSTCTTYDFDFLFPTWEGLILILSSLCWSYSVLIATLIFGLVLPCAYKYVSWATLAQHCSRWGCAVDLKRSEMIILVNFSRFLFHTSPT